MATVLRYIIREGLQAKQVSIEAANAYLKDLKSINRYNKSFKLFWAFCKLNSMSATSATLSELASMLLQFDKMCPSHGRFAYASLLLIPGLEQLQFNTMLKQVKNKWNSSPCRYVSFYDATNPIERLAATPLNWLSIDQVRLRLLLCCRFLMLCRNVDLERMFRKISFIQQKPFILMQRKGCIRPQWEAPVKVPDIPQICHWTLLKRYVALTAKHVKKASPVFISLESTLFALKS